MLNRQNKQKGFSLFLVLILMLVIAFLVIVTNQSSTTEMRISTNETDRKLAFGRSEVGLGEAEVKLKELVEVGQNIVFRSDCTDGYCAPVAGSYDTETAKSPFSFDNSESNIDAWKRCFSDASKSCQSPHTVLDNSNKSIATADGNGRYIIEYLGTITDGSETKEIFRITVKSKGDNEDTNVVLQSDVELTRE